MPTYDRLDKDNMVIYKDDGTVDKIVSPSRLEEELNIVISERNSLNDRIEVINNLLNNWRLLND